LKGCQKVFLHPGQSSAVTVTLDPRAFAYWQSTWLIGGGTYKILVRSSSRDIRLQGAVNLGKKTLGP
jgi:beta-glucosidase